MASQLYLWLEDQETRDDAAAAAEASRLQAILGIASVSGGASVVTRRLLHGGSGAPRQHAFSPSSSSSTSSSSSSVAATAAAGARTTASPSPHRPAGPQRDEGLPPSPSGSSFGAPGAGGGGGWGPRGMHYSSYLVAAAAASAAEGGVTSPRKAEQAAEHAAAAEAAAALVQHRAGTFPGGGGGDEAPTAPEGLEASPALLASPPPASTPAPSVTPGSIGGSIGGASGGSMSSAHGGGGHSGGDGDGDGSALLEHRHLSLRLRMSLTRLHALVRVPARKAGVAGLRGGDGHLPSLGFDGGAGISLGGLGRLRLTQYGSATALPPSPSAAAYVRPPRKLPERLAADVDALEAEVRACRHAIPVAGAVPPETASRATGLLARLDDTAKVRAPSRATHRGARAPSRATHRGARPRARFPLAVECAMGGPYLLLAITSSLAPHSRFLLPALTSALFTLPSLPPKKGDRGGGGAGGLAHLSRAVHPP